MTEETYHLYTDDVDTVVATSLEEASLSWSDWAGDSHDDQSNPWEQIPDDQMFPIFFDDDLEPNLLPAGAIIAHKGQELDGETYDDDYPGSFTVRVTAPASAWAASRYARHNHLLCTTEF